MKRLKLSFALGIAAFVVGGHAQAGKLSDFEDDATQAKKKEEQRRDEHRDDQNQHHNSNNDIDRLRDQQRRDQERENHEWERERERERRRDRGYPDTRDGTILVLPPPNNNEYFPPPPRQRSDGESAAPPLFGKETVGEFIIPFFRFDVNQGELASSITEKEYQIEVGYGPFALMHKQADLVEDDSHDELKSQQTFFFYRMNLNKTTEIDLGLGEYTLDGHAKNNESAYSLGFKWHPNNGFGLEYRPTWVHGNDIKLSEHELSASYGKRYVAIKLGYHWMVGDKETLKGPFMGFSIAY